MTALLLVSILLLLLAAITKSIFKRNMHLWLPSYCMQSLMNLTKGRSTGCPVHILFCLVDHFEPGNGGVERKVWESRVNAWETNYPIIAKQFVDSDGFHPRHTWFYPPHYYDEYLLKKIVGLCVGKYGEIELHLHHNRMDPFPDTSETLKKKILDCIALYSKLGIFTTNLNGKLSVNYAFIHGDWALDNSRKDTSFCGVNDELSILQETGCYADFTFPAYLVESQPGTINSVYYALDNPLKPKSYDTGCFAETGKPEQKGLMMIQGPLGLRWKDRKKYIFPKIEDADVSSHNPPSKRRIDGWIRIGVHVKNRPDWVIVKLHTHGAPESEHKVLLGGPVKAMHEYLQAQYNDGENYKLHYVTARELFNIIKAAENSETGDPGLYRNYIIPEYCYTRNSFTA